MKKILLTAVAMTLASSAWAAVGDADITTDITVSAEIARSVSVTLTPLTLSWTATGAGSFNDAATNAWVASDANPVLSISANAPFTVSMVEGSKLTSSNVHTYTLDTWITEAGTGTCAAFSAAEHAIGAPPAAITTVAGVGSVTISGNVKRNGIVDPYGIYDQPTSKMHVTVTEGTY